MIILDVACQKKQALFRNIKTKVNAKRYADVEYRLESNRVDCTSTSVVIALSAFRDPVTESITVPRCQIFLKPWAKNLAEFLRAISKYSFGIH